MIPESFPILSLLIFLPLAGAFLLLLFSEESQETIRWIAFVVALAEFLLSVVLFYSFKTGVPGFQFQENRPWIPQLGIRYFVGVDGVSLLLVTLTTLLTAIGILSSWSSINEKVKAYHVFMLILETGMLGAFLALDLFLFYIFWEVMLIPMYFLIGIWGGPRRIYAAVKFVIFTMIGSLLMLVAILFLVFQYRSATGMLSFNLLDLQQLRLAYEVQRWLFFAFFLAFAIKVPMFPLHTWLPDAHVEAPTAGSVILAGVLLKHGTYGFYRFAMPLFPEASRAFLPFIAVLAIIGIIYGALVALVQQDVKKLVAYSSVSHLGFVMLGLFALNPQGVAGAVLQMVNHGLSTGGLFLLVGMIYERRHTRLIEQFGGLWSVMPIFGSFLIITCLSSLGLPGLNGFVGEFLVLQGAFLKHWPYAFWAATGVILGAAYLLWMVQRVLHGPLTREENRHLVDLNRREILIMVSLVLLMFWIGLYPKTFTDRMTPSIQAMLSRVAPLSAQELVKR